MIQVKQALNGLMQDGLIASWARHTEGCRYRWSDYVVRGSGVCVENETLGTKSFLYFRCSSKEITHLLVESLRKNGGNPVVCVNGGPDKNAHIEMQVSKFKGYNWWM